MWLSQRFGLDSQLGEHNSTERLALACGPRPDGVRADELVRPFPRKGIFHQPLSKNRVHVHVVGRLVELASCPVSSNGARIRPRIWRASDPLRGRGTRVAPAAILATECIFWGPTPASQGEECRAASEVNIVGRVLNPEVLPTLTASEVRVVAS